MNREVMVREHLSYNIIPAMPQMIRFAIKAIEMAESGEWESECVVIEGSEEHRMKHRMDGHVATAADIIEGLRLEGFVEQEEV
jgi:hypothetical protein